MSPARKAKGSVERTLSADDPWLLARISESINSGLVVVDDKGLIVSFNRAAEDITGYQRDRVQGQPLSEALGEANREVLEGGELLTLTSGLQNRELIIQTRHGDKLTIGFTVSALLDEKSKRLGTVLLFKDLTEIASLREEMRRREHLATVGEMTASIAHEIRNPLAAMHTAAETLKEELTYDEDKEEYVDIILREIKRVNALVSAFFSYARPVTLAVEPFNIHELLDVLIFIEGAKMRKSGVTLQCEFGARPETVMADRNLTQQALLNILLNAYQATSPSGEVTITTSTVEEPGTDTKLCVAINDQGPGIEPEALKRIFEPFYSTKTKGIGLGLPITERVIKAMGGRIELQSELGRGSTFSVLLPVDS